MTAPYDLDRQLTAFLEDGPTELPEPTFDAVRDGIELTHQWVYIGPWRMPTMNKLVPIGLGAAAVVVALVVGTQFLGSPAPGGVGAGPSASPTPTTAPSPTPEPSVAAPSPSDGSLPEGSFVLSSSDTPLPGGIASTVTIAAPGWYGDPGGGILMKNENGDPPDGAAMIVFNAGPGWYVPGDPCNYDSTMPDTRSTTVDALVAALAAQASRDASAPADITVGGYAGKSITLHVPDDAVFANCDNGKFCTLADPEAPEASPGDPCFRYHQGPGQIDNMWIVDVNGQLVIIDWNHWVATPAEHVAELEAIVKSMTFE